jgi:probable rRNA maturation factor
MAVLVRSRIRRPTLLLPQIQVLTQHILSAAGDPCAEVSVDLTGDQRIRQLNRQYRGLNNATDVLAFPMREAEGPLSSLLGDVVISIPTAARHAAESNRSLDEELVTLLIHGVLHLLGFDHERSPREADRMRRKEQEILHSLRPLPRLVNPSVTI